MSTVTYSDPDVERYISEHFIPVKINVVDKPEMLDVFSASWTPAIIIHDSDEQEHRRMEGFFDPKRFIEELALARLKGALENKDYPGARERVAEAMNLTKGDPVRASETLYWSAVADYKASKNAEELTKGWRKLLEEYPESEWAKRAEFIKQ